MLSADGHLMPTRKDQPPPDLRYFQQPQQERSADAHQGERETG